MKVTLTALLALAGTEMSLAFLPSHITFRQPNLVSVRSMVKDAPTGTDVSVPYDAGARLAYDEWREQFGKGIFDEKRFKIFKTNYETITVANVSAKKKARDDGTSSLTLMSLNEYGDLTEEEYKQLMSSGSKTISTDDVLSKAVENAELQSEASSALSEAADAVAEEEKVRTK
jgi:Cathepsin propeptide inhibitor domain (I29)